MHATDNPNTTANKIDAEGDDLGQVAAKTREIYMLKDGENMLHYYGKGRYGWREKDWMTGTRGFPVQWPTREGAERWKKKSGLFGMNATVVTGMKKIEPKEKKTQATDKQNTNDNDREFVGWCKYYGYNPESPEAKDDYRRYINNLNFFMSLI